MVAIAKPAPWTDYVFALLVLFAVRPVAIEIALLGKKLPQHEVLTIGWFGPKGFSSVVYALMILQAGTPVANRAARVAGLAITASIVIYSSTDILVGRWFEKPQKPREKKQSPRAA